MSKPGAWNDPDYIQIGYIGSARRDGRAEALPAHAQRAVLLHVAVVPDGLAARSTAAT